jgi:hypothetical protein
LNICFGASPKLYHDYLPSLMMCLTFPVAYMKTIESYF